MFKRIVFFVLPILLLLTIGSSQARRSVAFAAENPGPMPTIAARIEALAAGEVSANDPAFYIVQLEDAPLARYDGSINGLAATSPELLGSMRVDITTPASVAYLAHLATQQNSLLGSMNIALGRVVETYPHRYTVALNGFAAWLTPNEATLVSALPNVKRVEREAFQPLLTDAGPSWIEAPAVWGGTATPDGMGTKGAGIVVGIVDTGVNSTNPSFSATTSDGHTYTNPRSSYYGMCDPITGLPACNDKLIGVWDFTGTTYEDDNNHGSHTASTAAGNAITITVDGNDGAYSADFNITGVAPHANLITYKACIAAGCVNISTNAAIDQAVADGVDVINYSIGGDSRNPWTDTNSDSFLNALSANVLVAVAAGNDGPGAQTIGSPSNAPWVASVAATKHDRSLTNAITGLQDSSGNPLPDITGTAYNSGVGPAPVVYAGDYFNLGDAAICEQPFFPGTFSGEIVICDRGVTARVEKCRNVELGGASGCILANDAPNGGSTSADPHDVPSIHISFADGELLKGYLAENSSLTATITATTIGSDSNTADVMAGFSSRGPDASVFDVLKPDLGAPGVDILAAYSVLNGDHGLLSGTSMASPHYAGALALMRDLHPNWTPAEVRSALMLTAFNFADGSGKETHDFMDDDGVTPADPHDIGAGRVDLSRAPLAGFVLDETAANFTAADPGSGGDPTTLNLASMSDGTCVGKCKWERTLNSTQETTVNWTVSVSSSPTMTLSVSPSSFSLAPDAQQTVCVLADVTTATQQNKWLFGYVTFTADDPTIPAATMPVAARAQNGTGDGIDCPFVQIPVDIDIATAVSVSEDAGSAEIAVTLSQATNVPVSVNYATADGSAIAASDYTETSGTLNFAIGETSKTINVPITDDADEESAETFTVALSDEVDGTVGNRTATVTIEANDAVIPDPGQIVVGDYEVREGEEVTAEIDGLDFVDMGALTFSVAYDPAVVTATACEASPDDAFEAVCNLDGDNLVRFSMVASPAQSGDFALGTITFTAVGAGGDATALTVDVQTNDAPVTTDDGSITIEQFFLGDVSCDGVSDVIDVLYIIEYEVNARVSHGECPLPAGEGTLYTAACDINNDASCDAIDARIILECVVGFENAFCSALAQGDTTANVQVDGRGLATTISAESLDIVVNQSGTISLLAESTELFSAFTIDIAYDPAIIDATACAGGGGLSIFNCNVDYDAGVVRMAGAIIGGTNGSEVALGTIDFDALGSADDTSPLQVTTVKFTHGSADVAHTTQNGTATIVGVPTAVSLSGNSVNSSGAAIVIATLVTLLAATVALTKRRNAL